MAKSKVNPVAILVFVGITMILLILLYSFKATIGVYILIMGLWLLSLIIISYIMKQRTAKEEEEQIKKNNLVFLDDRQAQELIKTKLEEKNILPCNSPGMVEYNISPEDTTKETTRYFIMLFEDKYLEGEYFLAYINRSTGIVNIIREKKEFSDKRIQRYLENSAESKREYEESLKSYVEPGTGRMITEKVVKRVSVPQMQRPIYKPKEQENENENLAEG